MWGEVGKQGSRTLSLGTPGGSNQMLRVFRYTAATLAAVSLAAIAVILFQIWNASAVTVVMPEARRGYTLDALALSISMMQGMMVVGTVIIAVLAFFGYDGMKKAAITAAREEAAKVADNQMRKFLRDQKSQSQGLSEHPGTYNVDDPKVSAEDAEIAASE